MVSACMHELNHILLGWGWDLTSGPARSMRSECRVQNADRYGDGEENAGFSCVDSCSLLVFECRILYVGEMQMQMQDGGRKE